MRTRVKVLKAFLVQQGCLQSTFQLSLFGSLRFRSCSRGLQLATRATQVVSEHEAKHDQLLRSGAGNVTHQSDRTCRFKRSLICLTSNGTTMLLCVQEESLANLNVPQDNQWP